MVKMLHDDILEDVEVSSEESDEEGEKDIKHKKLLNDLDEDLGHRKKREYSSSRTEPSAEISEYTWSSTRDKVSIQDLVGSLDSSCRSVAKVKKKLRKMENKTKVLNKPLEKVQRERVERSVAYEGTAKDIGKWNGIIQKNREAEQLVFPIGCYKPPPVSTKNMFIDYKPQNEMERQISDVLHGSRHLLERKDKELTEAEEKALQTVDLEEALERRKELQKTRALQSYYEVKCHRAKKIKSKKYHRMLKKDQQKALSKIDLETLSKENPELFHSEMEKAEQLRAKERAVLRHRNTSKWAKNLITKGHKSKEDQERIREQLRISRQLTEHKAIEASDDEGIEKELDETEPSVQLSLLKRGDDDDENPWLLGNVVNAEDNETPSSGPPKKYVKLQPITNSIPTECPRSNDETVLPVDDWEEAGKDTSDTNKRKPNTGKRTTKKTAKIKSKKKTATTTGGINENNGDEKIYSPARTLKRICENSTNTDDVDFNVKNIKSPSNNSSKLNKLDDKILDICDDGDSSGDDEFTLDNTEQLMDITEAFANDDVIGDFLREKQELVEKGKAKPVDLTLPGWGDWGGPGLTVSKKKRKRFTKDVGPVPKRKDDGNANVIINEKCNKMFTQHQVAGVPFPYSNKVEFERSIRQPIGAHWNTPSIHNKLIEPRVRIKPGVTIDPLKATRRMKKKFQQEIIVK